MKQNNDARLLAQAFVAVFALLLMIGILAADWLMLSGFVPECGRAGCAEPAATAKVINTAIITAPIISDGAQTIVGTPVPSAGAKNAHTEPTPTSPPMSADDAVMFTATAEWLWAYPVPGTVEAYP